MLVESMPRKALLTSRSLPGFKTTEYGSPSSLNRSRLALLDVLALEFVGLFFATMSKVSYTAPSTEADVLAIFLAVPKHCSSNIGSLMSLYMLEVEMNDSEGRECGRR